MRPNKAQEQALMDVLIASRKMYNACLEELITHYKETGKYLHLYEQDKRHGKKAHPDLPAVVVDTTLKRLHRSFTNFFRGLKEGCKVGFPRFKNAQAKKLAHAQRRLARCKKGSNRRKKAKHNVARHYERIANQRKDTLHKASRHYVDRYQTIAIEDLKPANMVQNHCLAFSIADASWGILRHYLESKAEHAGRKLIAVAPHYTSQKCSHPKCGEYVQKSLSVRTHVCPFCGYTADRDENAARNILQRGLQVLARTGPSSSRREGPEQSGESPSALKREAAGL